MGIQGPVGPAGPGFTLPYSGTATTIWPAFSIANNSADGPATGIAGVSNVGAGILGSSTSGIGGYFTSSSGVALETGTGKVGFGTSTPEEYVGIANETPDYSADLGIIRHGGFSGGSISLKRSRGTKASPTAIQTGDWLGGIDFRGSTSGNNYQAGALIYARSTQNFTPSENGTQIAFATAKNGFNYTEDRMVIDHNGSVGIGSVPDQFTQLTVGSSTYDGLHTNAIYGKINSGGTAVYGQNFGSGIGVFGSTFNGTAGLFTASDPVGIALFTSGAITHELDGIEGAAGGDQIHFDYGNSIRDLIIRASAQFDPEFVPSESEFGRIGTAGLPFWQIYSNEFFAATAGNYLSYSDARIKENIAPLTSNLEKIMQIQPKLYDIKRERYYAGRKDKPESGRLNEQGFLAQDVAKVFPKLVQEGENGTLAMSYVGLIPATIGSIQEQQAQIVKLTEENKALRAELEKQQALNAAIETRFQRIEAALALPKTGDK